MSTAFAHSQWPAQRAAAPEWRFGRATQVLREGALLQATQWVFKRNCSCSPRQMMWVLGWVAAVSLAIGLGFWWQGAPAVLPFAGIEALALCAAMLFYARHATDSETLWLAGHELEVEHHHGRRVQRVSFRAEWVCVEPSHGEGSLVELTGQGRRMRVGRYLRPDMRMVLARELRLALRRAKDRNAE